jgi:hypothetical protein
MAVPLSEICAMSRTLPLVGAVAEPPTVAPHAAIKRPGPSDPPAGNGAGVAPVAHDAGVRVVDVDVATDICCCDDDGTLGVVDAPLPPQPAEARINATLSNPQTIDARPFIRNFSPTINANIAHCFPTLGAPNGPKVPQSCAGAPDQNLQSL